MNDAVIVLNAGSSSLKFVLYGVIDQELSLEGRGRSRVWASCRFRGEGPSGEVTGRRPIARLFRPGGGHSEASQAPGPMGGVRSMAAACRFSRSGTA